MKTFEVNNEIELGNAIWSSKAEDIIILKSGEYGNIPIKDGVNYEFYDNATAADILGLGFGDEWQAGSVQIGDISIKNPRIQKANIKLYYIFQKKLPFNSRFEHPISFVHASGVILNIVGNDKEGFALGGEIINAESQLPKAIVNIIVPVLEEFDIRKADEHYLSSIFSGNSTEQEKTKELGIHQKEKTKKNEIEKRDLYVSLGLQLNEFEYKSLWALNSFIREYSKITNGKKINGYSISEFKDGLQFLTVNTLNENAPFYSSSFIENFQNQKIDNEIVKKLSSSFLASQEYSISEFTEYHLNHLNYPFATIGMYQEFESLWEFYSPDKKNKWGFIENFTTDSDTKAYLAEMVNARNNIVHSKKLETLNSDRNKLKTDWGAKASTEYEIFAKKRPWYWMKSIHDFKAAYNKQMQADQQAATQPADR